jgi:hypothetical protein
MYISPKQFISALLLCAVNSVWALELQQQNFSDDEIFSAVVNFFRIPLIHRFTPGASGNLQPLLVLGPEMKFGKKISSQSFIHLTLQELVDRQEAVFILINKAHPDADRTSLYVYYDIPSNASFGILKVHPKKGLLIAETYDSYRSSSGAREIYGRLYEGVTCRDNTEMAYRWSYYVRKGESGRCQDIMFTEFMRP